VPETTSQSALYDAICLSMVEGVGPRLRKTLLDAFGSATAVLSALPSDLRSVPGVGPKITQRIAVAREVINVQAELELCEQQGIRLITEGSDDYPRSLREIHDPPGVLYVRGELLRQDALAVAIVGSRHATQYGLAQAERLAASLSRAGLTIISGLARGVDAAAHRGALAAGGRTLAILGSGVLNIYPPEHQELALDVVRSGALISESSPNSPPFSGAFPQRNRIITGMSTGVIVVEAAISSGALISARHAMEQGREVFAVPGRVDNRMAHGCHRLIRDGAKLVETADDVLEELGHMTAPVKKPDGQEIHHPAELLLNELEQKVLGVVRGDATLIDEIVAESGLPTSQVLATLSVLEMRRLVRRVSGSSVLRP